MSARALSVSLPSEVVYVSGTVNGVSYTWTLEGSAWTATVARADNETYAVAITAVTASGTSTDYSFTLFYGLLGLITDRTQADVDRVKYLAAKGWAKMTAAEKAEWQAGPKGAYNATDLNRVGNAVNYLAGVLRQLPEDMLAYLAALDVAPDEFFAPPYDPAVYDIAGKVNWTVEDIPTPVQLTEYLAHVALLRAAFDYETDPLPESMEYLTFGGANAIEKALLLLQDKINMWQADKQAWADRTAKAWYFSGDLYAGEV